MIRASGFFVFNITSCRSTLLRWGQLLETDLGGFMERTRVVIVSGDSRAKCDIVTRDALVYLKLKELGEVGIQGHMLEGVGRTRTISTGPLFKSNGRGITYHEKFSVREGELRFDENGNLVSGHLELKPVPYWAD
jgi:hypothetical protein